MPICDICEEEHEQLTTSGDAGVCSTCNAELGKATSVAYGYGQFMSNRHAAGALKHGPGSTD